jgi:hypothetical protein
MLTQIDRYKKEMGGKTRNVNYGGSCARHTFGAMPQWFKQDARMLQSAVEKA